MTTNKISNTGTEEAKSSSTSDALENSSESTKTVEKVSSKSELEFKSKTDDKWLKYGDFTLRVFDKHVLESPKEWLTDTIINAAQHLLKSQFPSVKGLQNVLLNALQEFESIEAKESFVQIVNDGGNHWIVVSNARVANKTKKCVIYDSRGQTHNTYGMDVVNAVFKLMSANTIKVDIAFVSQQPDEHQCGLYAVAFAHLLCAGEDPSETLFSNSALLLRKHLMECLIKGEITRFPTGKDTIVDTYTI